MKKLRYISIRIKIAGIAAGFLIISLIAALWIVSYHEEEYRIFALSASVSAVIIAMAVYSLIIIPYKETAKIYEQFTLGYVYEDLFRERYPFSPESELLLGKLDLMLDRGKMISLSKKQAEYLALQNQINPHFLYNSLEGIRSEALIAGLDSVAEMTEALATFFRYTISHVENMVTLEDELANIENYYYIQQFRFGDKLALSIEYEHDSSRNDLELLSCRIPKLTLQPIVENSIYHGIERKIGQGHLTIKICASDEVLRIKVSDDGQGIDTNQLHEINRKLSGLFLTEESRQTLGGGIALVNVNNRIKLLFGEEYGLCVYSTEGVGTDVVVSLPRHIKE